MAMKKRWWWLVPIALSIAAIVYFLPQIERVPTVAAARAQATQTTAGPVHESKATKPICVSEAVPVGDCIPQRFANLPPDPGPEGMKTLEGIDSDKDGVRDDLQRFIVLNWGHSERAVMAMRLIAKNNQRRIELGDSVTRDEAYAIAKEMGKSTFCFLRSVDPSIRKSRALDLLGVEATNTEERFRRKSAFEYQSAHRVYDLPPDDTPLAELCGYEPASLPN